MRAQKPSDDNDVECGGLSRGKSVKRERKEKHLNLKMMTRMMKEGKTSQRFAAFNKQI